MLNVLVLLPTLEKRNLAVFNASLRKCYCVLNVGTPEIYIKPKVFEIVYHTDSSRSLDHYSHAIPTSYPPK